MGLAAGPFGNPTRCEGNAEVRRGLEEKLTTLVGEFESRSIFIAAYIPHCPVRSWLPDEVGGVLWFGPDRPSTNAAAFLLRDGGPSGKEIQRGKHTGPEDGQRWSAFNCGELLHDKVVVYDKGHKEVREGG